MKRVLFVIVIVVFVVAGAVYAQDDAAEIGTEEAASIIIQNFDNGEFEVTDEDNVFTLILSEANTITDLLSVSPAFTYNSFQTELFNLGLESAEGLEQLEAVLVLEELQVNLMLADFVVVDLENIQFTVEVTDIVPYNEDVSFEDELEFAEAELIIYLNATNSELIIATIRELGLGLRSSCFLC